ncbi:MBL fold metallo-hydrolase [Thalassotalea sp. HSM 43]|uniref:MBL fold metallo-hydrolase n=1 Tax=Thalassotalea sp. HSM 43 TaxID=2552945 RepID=UPI001081D5BE|nr:MBL fold metallo-hydrolase [Thalassotalea sp. HSM 43]QBY05599.1 MBL fold metallo-hydrolase [Thalassotalea sp. HSM 43]
MALQIQHFFHNASFTLTYVVFDDSSKECAIIDPALDYDPVASRVDTVYSQQLIDYVDAQQLTVRYILETHAHADHISSAFYLKQKIGGDISIGANIRSIQKTFKTVFNLAKDFNTDGVQFDQLLKEGDSLPLGEYQIDVLETPGHTADSLTYVIAGHAFVGDTLFMPDSGSARCDFPGGDAALLYRSIQKIYALGDDTKLYMCHDYQPGGRDLRFVTSVAEQKADNIQISDGVSEQDYVKVRQQRDATLANPKLIFPSLQCNIQAGDLPQAEEDEQHYFKTPIQGIDKLS